MNERVSEALQFVSSDDRETWVQMGMAVKSLLGDGGFEIWDAWSRLSDSYKPESAKAVWKSISQYGGITEGTLFHTARMNGWRDNGEWHQPTPEETAERKRLAQKKLNEQERKTTSARQDAARRARTILSNCELDRHAYMDTKGFSDVLVNVWRRVEKPPLMVVPVYYNDEICGVQLINVDGQKTFLTGQRMDMAYFKIGSGKNIFLCEGYATGLSAKEILSKLKFPYTIYVCFSAGNLKKMASVYREAFIFADNDESGTGERVANESGCRYWMPPVVGDDVNDYWRKLGTFKSAMQLKPVLFSNLCHS